MALNMRLISLPPGTQVGAWRLLGFRGRGIYGTVYAAERTDSERTGPAALKLAIRGDGVRGGCAVAINGGCWLKLDLEPDECRGPGVYLYQGGCYFPIPASQPLPTSEPADSEH